MTTYIQLVQPTNIHWGIGLAIPLLDKGLVHQGVKDKYPLTWVRDTIVSGQSQLWLVWTNNKIAAAIMTMVKDYPNGEKFLEVFLVGGWKMSKWAKQAYETIIEYAESIPCSTMAAGGRLGWNTMVKRYEKQRDYRVDSLVAIELR